MPKLAPLNAILETVTSVFPVFVSVNVCAADFPALTVPKFTFGCPTEICRSAPATSPFTGRVVSSEAVLLRMDTVPENVPAVLGVNATPNVALVPGFSCVEPEKPLTLKPAPLAMIPVTVNAVPPVFDS